MKKKLTKLESIDKLIKEAKLFFENYTEKDDRELLIVKKQRVELFLCTLRYLIDGKLDNGIYKKSSEIWDEEINNIRRRK